MEQTKPPPGGDGHFPIYMVNVKIRVTGDDLHINPESENAGYPDIAQQQSRVTEGIYKQREGNERKVTQLPTFSSSAPICDKESLTAEADSAGRDKLKGAIYTLLSKTRRDSMEQSCAMIAGMLRGCGHDIRGQDAEKLCKEMVTEELLRQRNGKWTAITMSDDENENGK